MLFPNAQQQGFSFEVAGLGLELTPNPHGALASVRKRPQAFASVHRVFASVHGRKSSRNAELSSLLDSRWVVASQPSQRSQGSGASCRETQNCRHFWTRVGSSHLKSVNSHRDRGVVVAKRRTVITFGLALGRRVSKVSTFTEIGGVLVADAEMS